jgi:hypothetical protein
MATAEILPMTSKAENEKVRALDSALAQIEVFQRAEL